jgi:hypothetical protein
MIRPVRYALLAALAGAALLVPATPAAAAAQVVGLNCVTTVTTDIHPGVSLDVHTFSVHSRGLTGTAVCTGTVDGVTVTGPGTFGIHEHVVGNCFAASGSGTFILKVPTTEGVKVVTGQFDLTAAAATGTVHTGDLSGTSRVIAANGDCVNTPVTQSTAVLTDRIT